MLRNVSCWDNELSKRYAIVGQEHNFQVRGNIRVSIDNAYYQGERKKKKKKSQNTITIRNRSCALSLCLPDTTLMSLMTRFAIKYPGAALPPKNTQRGTNLRRSYDEKENNQVRNRMIIAASWLTSGDMALIARYR